MESLITAGYGVTVSDVEKEDSTILEAIATGFLHRREHKYHHQWWWSEINDAFKRLWIKYQAYCRAIALKVVRDYDTVEDVIQLALIRAYRALERLSESEIQQIRLKPWLSQIVFNAALDEKKLRRRFISIDLLEESDWLLLVEARETDDPGVIVTYADDKKELHSLLDQLPWVYQEVIMRVVVYQENYEFAATELKCTVGTIRTRYHRAIRALAKVVNERGIKEKELRQWLFAYAQVPIYENEFDWSDIAQARNIL